MPSYFVCQPSPGDSGPIVSVAHLLVPALYFSSTFVGASDPLVGFTPSRTNGRSPNATFNGIRIDAEAYGSVFSGQCHAFPAT